MMHKVIAASVNEKTIVILDKISEKTGLSKSDIIRRAIEIYWKKIENE